MRENKISSGKECKCSSQIKIIESALYAKR